MKNDQGSRSRLGIKGKMTVAAVTGLSAGIGAALGVIACHQQWLG